LFPRFCQSYFGKPRGHCQVRPVAECIPQPQRCGRLQCKNDRPTAIRPTIITATAPKKVHRR
jgi:hypothetical protein